MLMNMFGQEIVYESLVACALLLIIFNDFHWVLLFFVPVLVEGFYTLWTFCKDRFFKFPDEFEAENL